MPIEACKSDGAVLFRLDGEFGPVEAKAVVDVLASAGRGSQLTIDFTRVREVQDIAIGALASAVICSRATVALRGLATHQRRMFRYLGVETEPAERTERAAVG